MDVDGRVCVGTGKIFEKSMDPSENDTWRIYVHNYWDAILWISSPQAVIHNLKYQHLFDSVRKASHIDQPIAVF
jgi:hypothetical protein